MQNPNPGPLAQPRLRPNRAPSSPALGGAGGPPWAPPGKTLPTGSVRPTAAYFFGGAIVPDSYASVLHGDCLQPEIMDGDMALVSPSQVPQAGEFIILHFAKGGPPWMKRLVMAPMFPIGTPLHPGSDVMSIVIVEMLNPAKQFMFKADQLAAMHRVVGLIRKDDIEALRSAPPQPVPKPARRRKAVAA